jgi:hypothetical protein
MLRALMIFLLAGAGWLIYQRLPASDSEVISSYDRTTLQLVLREAPENKALGLDMEVKLYPIDIVAVQHEFFTEPRAGKRFNDFLQDRMKGRSPVTTRLDKQGRGSVSLPPGNWWLHAKLSGDEELEWRLPVSVVGAKQTVELSVQNAYTRSKSF